MTFRTHIERLAGKCFYQLRQLRAVWGALALDASKAVVHAFVSSRVNYCNSISASFVWSTCALFSLFWTPPLVSSQDEGKYDHISDVVRDQLHWLPIAERIEYKLCSLVYKCLHQLSPKYLVEMCNWKSIFITKFNIKKYKHNRPVLFTIYYIFFQFISEIKTLIHL